MNSEDKFIAIACIIGMLVLLGAVTLMGQDKVEQAREFSTAIREGATPFDAGRYVYQEASDLWESRNSPVTEE